MEPDADESKSKALSVPSEQPFRYAAAFFAALAFARFATSFAFAAGESFRFGAVFFEVAAFPFCIAWNFLQRFFCAAAIRLVVAADIRRFGPEPLEATVAAVVMFTRPPNCFRIAVIFPSIFWSSAA
jgi:hypothetical protein